MSELAFAVVYFLLGFLGGFAVAVFHFALGAI